MSDIMGENIRPAQIERFLKHAGWEAASRAAVPGDASARRYMRLSLAGQRAVLMDAPYQSKTSQSKTSQNNTVSDYVLTAKLAGDNPAAFTAIAQSLTMRGFRAPKIFAADLAAGLLLLEDLGDDLFARVLEKTPHIEEQIYSAAIDCLAAIYRSSFDVNVDTFGQSWTIRSYDAAAMQAEVDLMLDWYMPYLGSNLTQAQIARWGEIWARAFTALEHHAPGLVLRDFHAENIFWLPDNEAGDGVEAHVGLIDFQDGLLGHPAYDLVSLIEDARRDVDPSLTDSLIARFCEKAKIADDERFRAAYAVMGAQRNAKILGIFVRLAQRDGKPSYLDLLPRVQAHFKTDCAHPIMKELRLWLEEVRGE